MKKVIVTGGRTFADAKLVEQILGNHNPDLIIEGGALGADDLARRFAKNRNKRSQTYKADWKDLSQPDARIKDGPYGQYDAQAGHRRNRKMLVENPDALVIAFPGGHGTADCINQAKELGMKIVEISKE